MKKILAIAFICVLPAVLWTQQNFGPAHAEVMMKTASLRSALLAKDSVGLANLLSDDVTYGHTNGLVQTKAELIRSVMSGEQDYKSIAPSEMKVRIYENAGVVTMKAGVGMLYKNSPLDFSMFVTLVWVKGGKDWKLVARQSVKL